MTPEEARALAEAIKDQLHAELFDSLIIGTPADEERTCRVVAEEARRRGIPVVRARMDGDCLVLDIAMPAGEG